MFFVNGGAQAVTMITTKSKAFLQASQNLALENIKVNEQVAQLAIKTVNEGKTITPSMIKEVVKIGKV